MLLPFMLSTTIARPPQGNALLTDLSKKAVSYFWEQSNPKTGLTKDRAANFAKTDSYIVASVAATGYALAAYAIGAHRKWIPRDQALKRSQMTVDWLNQHGLKEHGWFYHFVDGRTGERMWKSEASTIDTGLLLAGEIIADQEFKDPKFSASVKQTFENVDWKWMLTDGGAKPNEKTISMGWHPEDGFIKARWNGQYECTFFNLIALGASADVPAALWTSIRRTPVVTYRGIPFIIGGCIFMHEMSQAFLDFKDQRDELGYDYWIEGRNDCEAQRRYAIDDPKGFKGYGPNFWGLNAGDGPSGYEGNGMPEGTAGDDGTISPTGAIASILYNKPDAVAVANNLANHYANTMGIYGFSNGINPSKNWKGPDVIGIDLGMELLAIESARDGLPQKLSEESPIYRKGLKRAGFHKTAEGPTENRPLRAG
jgi:hypothetical protein